MYIYMYVNMYVFPASFFIQLFSLFLHKQFCVTAMTRSLAITKGFNIGK